VNALTLPLEPLILYTLKEQAMPEQAQWCSTRWGFGQRSTEVAAKRSDALLCPNHPVAPVEHAQAAIRNVASL
jgi:hypothetical protein